MADGRQPEDDAPKWDPSGGQEPGGTRGANGYSSSAYRTCQPGGAHMATAPYTGRENGFNGELTGAPAITAGNISFFFWVCHEFSYTQMQCCILLKKNLLVCILNKGSCWAKAVNQPE